jgi:HK97 family phage major capsid protein
MSTYGNGRVRGIVAARAEHTAGDVKAAIDRVGDGFNAFKAKYNDRVDALEGAFNSMAETVQAMRLGGAAVHPGAGIRGLGGNGLTIPRDVARDFHAALRGMPSAAMSTQSDPDGGFTVTPQVDGMIDAVVRDLSPLRQLARVVSIIQGDAWKKIITRAGSKTSWTGEEDTRTDLDGATLGQVEIHPREIYALPSLTNALLEDSGFDLQAFLSEDVAGEFAIGEGQAFISGNGIKRPMGFLSVPNATTKDATRAFGTLQYVATGVAGGFAASNPGDNLHDLLAALRPSYRIGDGVAWLMNSTTANVVRKFKDSTGNYLWAGSIAAGQPDRLLGYPVALDEGMPDIASGSFSIAFGNWQRGYAIVDKPGLRLIVDRVTQKGWTKMYFSKRVGGGVVDSNAIKLLKFSVS